MGALSKVSAKNYTNFKLGISRKKLAMLASAIGFVFCGHFCTMHFVQGQPPNPLQNNNNNNNNFLKRALTTSGAAILFRLVAMQSLF